MGKQPLALITKETDMTKPLMKRRDILRRHNGEWKDIGDPTDSRHPYKTEFDPMAVRFLPYGVWTFDDGSDMLFTRGYLGIWLRKDQDVWMMPKLLHHSATMKAGLVTEEYFRDDGIMNPNKEDEWIVRCRQIVADFISLGEIGHYIIE